MDTENKQLIKLRATIGGHSETHVFFAKSQQAAIASLDEGAEIEETTPTLFDRLSASKKPSFEEIGAFFSSLEKLTRTGISIVDSIKICVGSARTPRFKGILCDLYMTIKNEGLSLSNAIEKNHSSTFGRTSIAIIKSAELSGELNEALCVLVKRIESANKLQKQLKGALVYPMAMLVFALLGLVTILLFVLPKMKASFDSMGANLPKITAFMLKMSEIMQSQTWVLAILLIIPFLLIKWLKSKKNSAPVQYCLLKTPIVSELLREESLLQSFQVLYILLKTGASLPEGHATAIEVAQLKEHKSFFGKIKDSLEEGKSITRAYQENQWILGGRGREISQMMKIGETSNTVTEMLIALSGALEESVSIRAALLPKLVQPISTIFLFSVVGAMAAAIYLPQFQLVMQVMQK